MDENKFDIYIISLRNIERMDNIKKQLKIYNIFDAVNGMDINQNELVKKNILSPHFKYDSLKRSKEIACYLSHVNILENIKKNSPYNFSIIFEDDFIIKDDQFYNKINDIINNVNDFDIIFLGNLNNNHKNNIYKNIYTFDETEYLWGTYAYLINKNSIDKIINEIKFIEKPIDIKYNELALYKKLNILTVFPTLIDTNLSLLSTILD